MKGRLDNHKTENQNRKKVIFTKNGSIEQEFGLQ